MTDNVIVFPKPKRNSPPNTLDEIIHNSQENRKEHIEFIIQETLPYIFGKLYDEGYDLCKEDNIEVTGYMIETFRAALYAAAGIDHELHEVADEYIGDNIDQFIIDESAFAPEGEGEE